MSSEESTVTGLNIEASISKETIKEIILLAKDCYPEPARGRVGIDLGDYTFDESFEKKSGSYNLLVHKIESLNKDEITAIEVLLWLGRDTDEDTKKDLDRLLEESRKLYDKKDPVYLAENCRLAEYLEAGLVKLSKIQSTD